jgi:excisionase family DNA binding protein
MGELKYYTVKEVSEILQAHWQTILNYIKDGKLKAIRVGKGYRIPASAIEEYAKANQVKVTKV